MLCSGHLFGERRLVDGRLEVHVAGERDGVGEREDLGGPEPAEAVCAVDPEEEVGQPSSPAGRPVGASSSLIIERVRPGLGHAGETLIFGLPGFAPPVG